MNKILVLSLILVVGLFSCQNSEKSIDKKPSKLEISKQYYKALDGSNTSQMSTLLGDTIVVRETADNYEERFSQKEYKEWMEWDSVFSPTYTVLEINQEYETVTAKISKIDKRISFLHEVPIVWNEIIRFDNDKIVRVERVEYEVFDVPKFIKTRNELVAWIDKNHSELSGFLFPQTKLVGMKYLEAIELYKKAQ